MQKANKRLLHIIATVIVLLIVASYMPFSATVKAENKAIDIQGEFYEFGEDSDYTLSKYDSVIQMDHNTIGSVKVSGKINQIYTKSGVTAFEVAD